jgi:hypothetical protein
MKSRSMISGAMSSCKDNSPRDDHTAHFLDDVDVPVLAFGLQVY